MAIAVTVTVRVTATNEAAAAAAHLGTDTANRSKQVLCSPSSLLVWSSPLSDFMSCCELVSCALYSTPSNATLPLLLYMYASSADCRFPARVDVQRRQRQTQHSNSMRNRRYDGARENTLTALYDANAPRESESLREASSSSSSLTANSEPMWT